MNNEGPMNWLYNLSQCQSVAADCCQATEDLFNDNFGNPPIVKKA